MPSRTPGGDPDPAAELLGRWTAHHTGTPEPAPEALVEDADGDAPTSSPVARDEATDAGDDVRSRAGAEAATRRHAAPRTAPGRRRPLSARGADRTEAGREVVEALRQSTPSAPQAPPAADRHLRAASGAPSRPTADPTPPPEPTEGVEPAPETPAVPAPRPRRTYAPPAAVEGSADVEFPAREALRRVLAALVLGAVLATCVAGFVAYQEPTTLTVGVAATLGVVTLLLYAVRASSTPARLAIRSGQLEVVRGGTREVFDLTSRFTRMEVVGRPDRRGWKVLMARFGRDPLVIDASMVDPMRFTAAIERHRPRQHG